MTLSSAQRRDFWFIAIFRAASACGDEIAMITLMLRLAGRPHAGVLVGALAICNIAPMVLLAPVSGWIVDRVPAKSLVVPLCVVDGLVAVMLGTTTNTALTLVLMALLGASVAFTAPAYSALVPAIVGEENVIKAQGSLQAASGVAFVAGPLVGGLLVGAFGQHWPLFVDAISFALLAVGTAALVGNRVPEVTSGPRARGEMSVGVRFLFSDGVVRPLVILLLLVVLSLGIVNVVLVLLVVGPLHGTALEYGLTGACLGLGLIGGSLFAGRIPQRSTTLVRAMFAGAAVLGVTFALVGVAPNVWWTFAPLVIGGIGNSVLNVTAFTLVTLRSPEEIRGRVFAGVNAVFSGAQIISMAAGGLIVTWLSARVTVTASGAVSFLTVVVLAPTALRAVRRGDAASTPADSPVAT